MYNIGWTLAEALSPSKNFCVSKVSNSLTYSAMSSAPEKETEGVSVDEAEKVKSDSWRLEPQPIREDQVENAVKFLSHDKVRASPIVHRRSFLERKGLSREEIDEAFRRCPVCCPWLSNFHLSFAP